VSACTTFFNVHTLCVFVAKFGISYGSRKDTRWYSWLRHCATSRQVAGSIPDGVFGIFYGHNPSGPIMALMLTLPLTEMSTRNISWGPCGRCVALTTLSPSCADCLEIWEPQLPGKFWACPGLEWDCFTFVYDSRIKQLS